MGKEYWNNKRLIILLLIVTAEILLLIFKEPVINLLENILNGLLKQLSM